MGEWTAVDRRGEVMEVLVKMAEVLVKNSVMMMAPGGVPAPPEARGRESPCRCQNRWISGRGSQTVRLGGW